MSLKEQFDARNAGLPPPCVETDTQTQMIVVYPSPDESWVFPWSRFGWASLRGGEMKLIFSDQEIVVQGKNLGTILPKIRECHVEVIRTVAEHFRPLLKASDAVITSIEVRPNKA